MKQCFYGSKTNEPYAVYRGEQPLYGAKNEISGTGSITYMTTGLPVQVTEIKGNTVQNGTPSPDNPVDVQGVGERTANLIPFPFYRSQSENFGVKFTANPDQSVTAIGTPTGLASIIIAYHVPISKLGLIPGDTVYLGWESTNTNLITQIRGYNSAGDVVMDRQAVGFYTIPEGTVEITIVIKKKDNILIDGNIKAILAKSSVALPYEPYGYKIPVLNVGKKSTTDNIYLDEPLYGNASNTDLIGEDGVRKVWQKIVFDGTEDWIVQSRNEFGIANHRLRFNEFIYYLDRHPERCSHFVPTTKPIAQAQEEAFYLVKDASSGDTLYFRTTQERANTAAEFKAWLKAEYDKGTPVTMCAALLEPTTTSITLPVISAEKGTYTVTTDTAIKPSGIKITASGKQV